MTPPCLKPARRCRSLGYQYKQAKVMYRGVEICLFFSRRGKSDKWKVLWTFRFRYDNYESKGGTVSVNERRCAQGNARQTAMGSVHRVSLRSVRNTRD